MRRLKRLALAGIVVAFTVIGLAMVIAGEEGDRLTGLVVLVLFGVHDWERQPSRRRSGVTPC